MRRRKRRSNEDTELTIKVERFEADVEVRLNLELSTVHPSSDDRDDEPVFPASTKLRIRGHATQPQERAGEAYEITLSGEPSARMQLKLKDVHVHDEGHAPVYRTFKGEDIPVYNAPPGFATFQRRRKDGVSHAWITLEPRIVTDMLLIAQLKRPLFLAIDEMKVEKERWIRGISLQTADSTKR
jgi:hypothetical protein